MNSFDKLYKKSRETITSKSTSGNAWLRNASCSIGKSALSVVNEYIPAGMETGVSIRDVKGDLQDTILKTKQAGIVKAGALMSMGKSLWQNSLEDLKSGNFYNQARIDAAENASIDIDLPDFDFGEDFDTGEDSFGGGNFDVDMTSDDGQSSVQMSRSSEKGNEVTQINIETNLGKDSTLVQATQQQTQISVKTAQQLAEVSSSNTKVIMSQLSKMQTTLSGHLAAINENVSGITTVVSESLTSHVSISAQYYEDSMTEFREIKELVTGIKEIIQTTSSTNELSRDVTNNDSVFDVFNSGGGLNFRNYGSLVKKQFNSALMSTPLGLLISFGSMMKMPGMDMTAELKASPISSLITMGMKKLIPNIVKKSIDTFNDQMKETLATGLVKVGGLRSSTNPILQFIGNMFGVRNEKYTANKKNYSRGPMAWNGIAHRTLVDVIPSYLSQIAAAVTGTEQKVFDYEQGKYESLSTIRKDYDRTKKRNKLSAHYDVRNEFDKFVSSFDMESKRRGEFIDKFDDYLMKISDNLGTMDFRNSEQLKYAVGGDEQIAKMIQKFMQYADKPLVTATYGSNALRANEDVSDYEKRLEKDPTGYNAQYIKNGLTTISPGKSGGILGTHTDEYSHDNLYYLRKILQTINTSVPVRIIKGGKGFNKRMLSGLGADSTISNILRDETDSNQSSFGYHSLYNSRSSGLSMDDLDLPTEELKTKIKENNRNPFLDDEEEKQPFLMKLMKTLKVKESSNTYKLASNASSMKKNAGEKTASFFDSMSNMMFSLLFGEGDEKGIKGVTTRILGGVKTQMKKFGSFIDTKLIGPLNESLFGEEGLITSIQESETIKNIKEKISSAKLKATEFLFGTKDDEGKRTGGLFSDTFNSIKEMGTTAKDFILHDEDGIVGSLKGMYHSVTASVKKSLGVDDKDTEKVPISKKIANGASDFVSHIKQRGSEWMDLIFGGKDTKLEDAKDNIISGLDVFKEDMKGKKGKLGASASLGVLGSFFLPGGPILGALVGLATGIVSESTQLKDFLFGKLDENDERGGGIISREFQNFFKDHKTGITIGATAGVASSIGLLPSFFVPGGPIGGALIGGAIALAHKSGVFNELLYGEDGSEDNVTGGITKFIKDHYKKDGNIKSTFMDAGIGAGVGIMGSFFLPGGPILGALIGSATSIAINTDKFKNLMFGEEILDENGKSTGKRKGGLFGKFTDYIGDKVLLPLSKAAKETQVKILGFIEEHMVNPLKVAMKPFQIAGKNFMDGVKATISDLKESFKQRVTKPIGDAVHEHIIKPMGDAFKKIFGGIGKIIGSIIASPFKFLQGAAGGLNKDQKKKGQTDYDLKEALAQENEKTKVKYEEKLAQVKEENAKRTKWKNPFDTFRKKKQPDTTEPGEVVDTSEKQTEVKSSGGPLAMNIQFFASSKGGKKKQEESSEQTEETTISEQNTSSTEESSKDSKETSKFSVKDILSKRPVSNIKFGRKPKDQETTGTSPSTNTSSEDNSSILSSIRKHLSSIDSNVEKITNSVDGQLNGVGYNVNKILRILLKKNGMSDEDVEGDNNKKYSRGGRFLNRIKGIIFAPFRMIKNGVNGAIETVKGVIDKAREGVTKIAKGLIALPKTLWKAGTTIIKGIGTAALSIAKGVGSAITTGLTAVGNVITGAATGFGKMIGAASEGFGQLVGGALGGLGQLLHGVGLITKELAPVIAKGIGTIIKAPFKLIGAAGGFISNLFNKRKGGKDGSKSKVMHVIVDEYRGEDRVINALHAIEFAILHGAPMDGEGPKFKGTSIIPVLKPGEKEEQQEEQEEHATKMSLPFNLQFFANKGKNGNGLPNVAKAETKEQEKAELQTRIAEGSASEINERFDAEDEREENRGFRAKLLSLFKANNQEQKKQGFDWSKIFSKKGLITAALIALSPMLIKLLPGLIDFVKNVGPKIVDALNKLLGNVLNNADSQGGLPGILNGVGEQVTSVQNLLGQKDREEAKIGENGEIISDENGQPITEVKKDGLGRRITEFYVPTTTKIDHETGQAYQERQYDATTRAKIHATRSTYVKGKKKLKKIGKHVSGALDHVPGGKRLKQGTKNLKDVASVKASNLKDNLKNTISNEYTKLYDNRIAGKNGMSKQFMQQHGQNATMIKEMTDDARLDSLRSGDKKAYKAFDEDIVTRAKDRATIIKEKGTKFLDEHQKLNNVKNKAVDIAGNAKDKIVNTASNLKTSAAAKIQGTKIEQIIKLGKEALTTVKDKFIELVQKHVKGGNTSKITKFISNAIETIFKPSMISKYFKKFTGLLSKIATMASTLATSEIFWGITGAVEGATNAAYTFEVSDEDVDWKMRLIAGTFRALLATSIGGWVDLVDAILYEISGTSFVNELAVIVYKIFSSDEDDVKLDEAREKFNEKYKEYVEEEYQKYAENQAANGQEAMSFDEFKGSNLATSRQTYNSEQNKSAVKRAWDAVQGGYRKVKNSKFGQAVHRTNVAIAEGATKVKDTVVGGAKKVGGVIVGGAKKVGTVVKGVYDKSILKKIVDGTMNAGPLILQGVGGILKNAWTGDKEDLLTLPEEAEDPSTVFAKFALIGANVLMTPIKLVVKVARKIYDTAKLAWTGIKVTTKIAANAVGGRLSAAWKGEEYQPPQVDENQPFTKMAAALDAGVGALISPITLVTMGARKVYDTAKLAWTGLKVAGKTAANAVGGRLSAAWKGEEYQPPEVDENQPITKMVSALDAGIGFLISPITFATMGAHKVFETAKLAWKGIKFAAGTVKTAVGGRLSAAWKGEEYQPPEVDENQPITKVASALDAGVGVLMTPITFTVMGIKQVLNGVKKVFSVLKDVGSSIADDADIFSDKTTMTNYWKAPKEDGVFGSIKSVLFYIVRSALFIPFTIIQMVKTLAKGVTKAVDWVKEKGGALLNGIANIFGAGSAFNTEEDSGGNGTGAVTGGFGDAPAKNAPKKTSLNGFTYYSQNDSSIKDQSYDQTDGTPGTMGERGCGPTALSMVASEVTGENYDPISMANVAKGLGYSTDVGTTTGYFSQVGSSLGMNVASGQADPNAIKTSLTNGNPVILQGMGDGGPYTSGGHYVVGVGMKDGKVLVNDPRGAQYSKAYSMQDIMNGASGMWSFSGGKGPSDSAMSGDSRYSANTETSVSSNKNAEDAVVNAMYSVKERNQYSQSNREHVGDTLNGASQGSGDCSSTVRWAYQTALGIDPGSYTGEQVKSANGFDVDKGSGGPPNESNLRPGDLLFYTKSGRNTHAASDVGHVEMYVGNDKLMGHGSGIGPKERQMSTYRLADYIGARRFIGDGTSVQNNLSGGTVSSSDGNNNPLSGGFSLSSLFSGAIGAVTNGINNFFGIKTSNGNDSSTSSDTSMSGASAANLSGSNEAEKIWNFMLGQGYTKAGAAAILGNFEQESGNHSVRLQGDYAGPEYAKSQEYAKAADSGTNNFVNDKKGFGLAQWTYHSRKQNLLNFAKSKGTSVGDLGTQLEFYQQEVQGYPSVVQTLKTSNDVSEATRKVMNDFEAPGDPSLSNRINFANAYYNQFQNLSPNTRQSAPPNYGTNGGFGDGKPTKNTSNSIAKYSSNNTLNNNLTRRGNVSIKQSAPRQLKSPIANYESTNYGMKLPSGFTNKLFDYLGRIVTYLEAASSGISSLNQKDFGGTQNYISTPPHISVNGGTQQPEEPDTTNYELGKQIAYGQLA